MRKKMSIKEKCFRCFAKNDYKEKDELIKCVVKRYKITQTLAMEYYYSWKKVYMYC
ncbi:MAG: hypothetical protein LKF87_14670 [Clostridium tyrobutyricum]|jgi:hypothetical protein|uniref:hypothetical protein n=1 Tax=Clostridium tyrobutyricum TaxID=1519 RepID=UPI00242D109D|nr:hypothetical protein [Clostridium tyrobutyricum]MCH4200633.1 hypothetical protein [Clostridium tyrobutyricum]MCH4237531.1 hypothetical protein [Clostridium tyrobutyricum]MCH4260157.1 hypothetical protein [Clostridium tyrobutyricum]MCI2011733.1 hypothetical protein [Clostridium tyrobutyricum]